MFLSLLGKISGVTLLGGAIVGVSLIKTQPSSSSELVKVTKVSKEIKLEGLEDYKRHCKLLTPLFPAQQSSQEDMRAYLLICETANSAISKEVKAYLYQHKPTQQPLKEVQSYEFRNVQEGRKTDLSLTLKYSNGSNETFNVTTSLNLDKLNNIDIKTSCFISEDWQYRQLPCRIANGTNHTYFLKDLGVEIGQ